MDPPPAAENCAAVGQGQHGRYAGICISSPFFVRTPPAPPRYSDSAIVQGNTASGSEPRAPNRTWRNAAAVPAYFFGRQTSSNSGGPAWSTPVSTDRDRLGNPLHSGRAGKH